MQKRLLVIAAGILQVPVIKRAREMGYYVIAADGNPSACGFEYADKSDCVNITNPAEMLQLAKSEQIDGVIHPCSEVAMNVMGHINDALHLSGISEEQAIRATNKHLMREAFERGHAPSPKSSCFSHAEVAWSAFCTDFKGDCILKPSRNSGSRGISKISERISEDEFARLFEISKSESRDNSVMLEQFVDGPEFSVEIIVWNKMVNVLTVTDKKTTEAPHFVELGHNQPSCFPSEIVEKIKQAAIAGVEALGVDNCACHAEIKVMDSEPYIMEIGARMGGDFISTVLTRLSTGIDMIAAAVNCALGIEPVLKPTAKPQAVCIRYFCPKPGVLKQISNLEFLDTPQVYEWEFYHKVGDVIPEVTSSLSRSGHIIVIADTPNDAIELAESLVEKVNIETI